MKGQITTCYSFKGGSGRSMSVANLAWVLASRGQRVLVVDWDLEAPGIHRYFHPFLADPSQQESRGLIDALWAYVNAVPDGAVRKQADWATMSSYVQRLSLPLTGDGAIDLLGAGMQDETYTTKVGNFDWNMFYSRLGGKTYVDHFGEWARSDYDHVLIDSRTGVSDTAGICTMQLPDVLALFFVYNRQSIEGAAAAGRAVRNARDKSVRIVPCPSRVEDKRMASPARQYAALCFEDVMQEVPAKLARTLRVNEVMHFPWCSYEEKLAVFEEEADETGTLLQATQALSARVAGPFAGSMEVVEKDRLNIIWRRAAFRDPRLDDLEVLRSGTTGQKLDQLGSWLGETLGDGTAPAPWDMVLAAECVLLSASLQGMHGNEADRLGQGAVDLARRALKEGGADRAGVADILRARASHLMRLARLEEAEVLAEEAMATLGSGPGQPNRLAMARVLEVKAAVASLRGNHATAMSSLDRLVALLGGETKQGDPVIQELRARAERARATTLLDNGEYEAAGVAADRAWRTIAKGGPEAKQEAALTRLVGVRALLAGGRPGAEREVERLRQWLKRETLPEPLLRDLGIRLTLAEADYYREAGDLERARTVLRNLGDVLPVWASAQAAELLARIEVIGSMDLPPPGGTATEAAERLEPDQVLRLLSHALASAPDDATRQQVVLDYLSKRAAPGEKREPAGDPQANAATFDLISRALLSRVTDRSE